MNMSIRPRFLVLAAAAAVGLYFAGVPGRTLLLLGFGAYMMSMHFGGHGGHGGGGHGGHGGGGCGSGGHSETESAPGTPEDRPAPVPPLSRHDAHH